MSAPVRNSPCRGPEGKTWRHRQTQWEQRQSAPLRSAVDPAPAPGHAAWANVASTPLSPAHPSHTSVRSLATSSGALPSGWSQRPRCPGFFSMGAGRKACAEREVANRQSAGFAHPGACIKFFCQAWGYTQVVFFGARFPATACRRVERHTQEPGGGVGWGELPNRVPARGSPPKPMRTKLQETADAGEKVHAVVGGGLTGGEIGWMKMREQIQKGRPPTPVHNGRVRSR